MAHEQTALYVESGAGGVEAVAELIGPVFRQQRESDETAADIVLLERSGWTLVLGAAAIEGREILAEGLSRELGGRAVALDLWGAAPRYSVVARAAGKALLERGWRPEAGPRDPMPRYPDVELDAFAALRNSGVPADLALACPDAVGTPGEPLEALVIRSGGEPALERRELWLPRTPSVGPPVRLSRLEPGDGIHLDRALEPRAVHGVPNAAALRRLLDLEAAYRERVLVAAGRPLDVRFLYRRASGEPLDLAREAERFEAPSLIRRLFEGRRR